MICYFVSYGSVLARFLSPSIFKRGENKSFGCETSVTINLNNSYDNLDLL